MQQIRQKTTAPDVPDEQVPQRTTSMFAQQTDQNLLTLITAHATVQRVRRLVKSVGRGVVPVHFSNVPSFCSFLRGEGGLRRQTVDVVNSTQADRGAAENLGPRASRPRAADNDGHTCLCRPADVVARSEQANSAYTLT